ncbi:MAG: efflux RND transporter periplasmic adaptor subunit [Prochloraceae cyanobacterium]|nr:efflux RND transporter periplasmic adaptor subunit [Prochloraceae cyanobacterium]
MVKIKTSISRKLLGTVFMFAFLATSCSNRSPQNPNLSGIPVQLQKVETGNLEKSSTFVGNLEAKEKVVLAPRINGRITRIFVENGNIVTIGKPIVQLEPTKEEKQVTARVEQVNAQKAVVTRSLAQLKLAEAELARATAEVERHKAQLRTTKSDLELAKKNIERAKFLVEQGAQARQELDNTIRDFERAKYQREATQEALNAANKSVNAAREQVKAAMADIDREKSSLKQTQAQVGVATQDLKFNQIVAPISGEVGSFPVKVGEFVTIGQQLTTITQNQTLELNINVPIDLSSQLRVGLPVQIVKADNTTEVTGKISFISPKVDQQAQTILAKATFKNNGNLRDDQFVTARIIWESKPGVLIPTVSVSRIGGQEFVFIAETVESKEGKSNLIAKQKPVKLGDIQGQKYQVISGIKVGETIVTSGILNLKDGVTIAPQESQQSQ